MGFRNECETTATVCGPINKPNFIIWKVTYHICSKILRLQSTQINYSFYNHNQNTALNGVNKCEPGVSMVHIATECKPRGAHQASPQPCWQEYHDKDPQVRLDGNITHSSLELKSISTPSPCFKILMRIPRPIRENLSVMIQKLMTFPCHQTEPMIQLQIVMEAPKKNRIPAW